MKTSKEWWDCVKKNQSLLEDWLIRQWRGEITAARRIQEFAEKYTQEFSQNRLTLNTIFVQETKHASLIKGLLDSRGIVPDMSEINKAELRYWKETLPEIEDFETGCAIGAHAEAMRLERIRAIVEDPETESDIRLVFEQILNEEIWHERAFRELSSTEAMNKTKQSHLNGLNALGLEA